jgi:hypothetical protein
MRAMRNAYTLVEKSEEEKRPRILIKMEDNIKINLKQIRCKDVNWICQSTFLFPHPIGSQYDITPKPVILGTALQVLMFIVT